MNWMFKMMGPVALSLVAFTGFLHAAEDAHLRNLDNRVTALEEKKGGSGGMINPPARPVVTDGVDIFFTGEILVWRARQDNMDYAVQLDQVPTLNGINSGNGVHFRGKWRPGIRLGIGYNMPHDGWDLNLTWTNFLSKDKKHGADCDCCQICNANIFEPIYYPKDSTAGAALYVDEANAKYWRARLNMADLELGREFFVSKWLTVRPHIGVRGMWLHQKQKFEYEGGNFFVAYDVDGVLPGANQDFVFMKNNFWGVGLRGGLDSTWGLGAGVSLYGKVALSALWGKLRLTQNHDFYTGEGETGTNVVVSNFTDKFQVCRPVADLAFGLRYDATFNDDSWGLGIWAGWEHHYFWGQSKFIRFGGDTFSSMNENNGDFSVAGVNIGMGFDF